MIADLALLYARDLNRTVAEIEAYRDEASLWVVGGQIANSGGNLALHLAGNLRQFVGEDLGGVPYERDRPGEFGRRNVPRAEVLAELQKAAETVQLALAALTDDRLDRPHPRQPPGFPEGMTSGHFLLHLYGHLNYHLGQINYHRRLLARQD